MHCPWIHCMSNSTDHELLAVHLFQMAFGMCKKNGQTSYWPNVMSILRNIALHLSFVDKMNSLGPHLNKGKIKKIFISWVLYLLQTVRCSHNLPAVSDFAISTSQKFSQSLLWTRLFLPTTPIVWSAVMKDFERADNGLKL